MNDKSATLIELPAIKDPRGNLTFLENITHFPFTIKRAYWIYDVPGGQKRGGHAFKEQKEVIIALSGSFDIVVNDGQSEQVFQMNRSYYGLYVPNGYWRHIENFSTNSVALVLSSTFYNQDDYIRDFKQFTDSKKQDR
ncbi:MAG: WxcM-like domain-containing protein [Chitinophagaceae bacterium]|nr:MAG: WxcM-like domain-containing protein [Chitinophagaceae bacterium]